MDPLVGDGCCYYMDMYRGDARWFGLVLVTIVRETHCLDGLGTHLRLWCMAACCRNVDKGCTNTSRAEQVKIGLSCCSPDQRYGNRIAFVEEACGATFLTTLSRSWSLRSTTILQKLKKIKLKNSCFFSLCIFPDFGAIFPFLLGLRNNQANSDCILTCLDLHRSPFSRSLCPAGPENSTNQRTKAICLGLCPVSQSTGSDARHTYLSQMKKLHVGVQCRS